MSKDRRCSKIAFTISVGVRPQCLGDLGDAELGLFHSFSPRIMEIA
jgi:hypothetical protein